MTTTETNSVLLNRLQFAIRLRQMTRGNRGVWFAQASELQWASDFFPAAIEIHSPYLGTSEFKLISKFGGYREYRNSEGQWAIIANN